MIKTLLDADENPPPDTKVIIEETVVEMPTAKQQQQAQNEEAGDILEIPSISPVETTQVAAAGEISDKPIDAANFQTVGETSESQSFILPADYTTTPAKPDNTSIFQTDFKPETQAETMRKSGLAYAAAITLFGAVVFMMILGWGADLLLGTKPWGIIGGILLGAIIGFVQFFRLTSQIIKNKE